MGTLSYGGEQLTGEELLARASKLLAEAEDKRKFAEWAPSLALESQYNQQAEDREVEAQSIRDFVMRSRGGGEG